MNENMFFLLDENKKVIPAKDCLEWAEMFENTDRSVANTEHKNFRISTVFMGLNLDCLNRQPPVVFETILFMNGKHLDMWRYQTYDKALENHNKIADEIKNGSLKELENEV